ncbi:hypothetical protein M9Y10_044441 [Tritrichomonas musculus]|uniref:Uncharacterized protein n=1 Tax=Tritrichomonas musculus TaxID=1915356 RepID=A0ABR2JSC4_9EUKA
MNELVAKHKDIQTKILEYIDNESNDEDDTTILLKYLTDMDLNVYDVNLILHFLSRISCNHHRNIYFFIKIKQIINFYMTIIKENFSSLLISQIFRKSKPLLLHFYKEKILNIEDLVKKSRDNDILVFFYPEIESNIFELIKNKKIFNIIIDNIKLYLNDIHFDNQDYPFLKSFSYGKTNQVSDSFLFNKIKSFLEKAFDDKIKDFSIYFILHSTKSKEKNNDFYPINYFGTFDKYTSNIFDIFYSKLLVFNGNLNVDRDSNCGDYSNITKPDYFIGYHNDLTESTINKYVGNEKCIYKLFFNCIKKIISRKGNKCLNVYIEICRFFKYVLGPVLNIVFLKKFFEDKNEKRNDSDENDENQDEKQNNEDQGEKQNVLNEIDENQNYLNENDENLDEKQNDSDENDLDQDYLNEEDEINNDFEEEECYEDNILYQKMYPKIKRFLDDVTSQMNTMKDIKYQQISSKVISFCDELINDELEYEFNKLFEPCLNENFTLDESFEANRQKGENESYICQLIRDDLIDEFISYTNKVNYPLNDSIIPSSIFETHSFLMNKQTSLIEYSAFFGSIQIFHYLLFNKVELRPELWLYAIHGRNAEIIHMIEENHIKPKDESYTECFFNSIKCYHNEIAAYIHDNLYDKEKQIVTKRRIIRIINLYCDLEEKKFNTSDEVVGLKIIKTFNIEFFSEVHLTHFDNKSSLFKNNMHLSYVEFLLWTNDDSNKSLILQIASHNKNYSSIIDFLLSTSTEIEPAAFERSSIQKITIPNSIRMIGNDAFCESLKLTEVVIPSSVVEIGEKAFYGCHSLQKVVLSKSIKKLGDFVFSQCSSLRQIIIPSSVTHIGDYAFNRCKSLSFVSMPSSVISIGKYAFRECKSLKEITIPSPVTKIGEHAFNSSSLKYALIISSNKSIEDNVFPPQTYVFQIMLD